MSLKLELTVALLISLGPAHAHDIYTDLTDRNGFSCCNNRDCHPAKYRMTPDGVEMFIDRKWIGVPNSRIQYRALPGDSGETDGGHWCGYRQFYSDYSYHQWESDSDLLHDTYEEYFISITLCAILPPQSN